MGIRRLAVMVVTFDSSVELDIVEWLQQTHHRAMAQGLECNFHVTNADEEDDDLHPGLGDYSVFGSNHPNSKIGNA